MAKVIVEVDGEKTQGTQRWFIGRDGQTLAQWRNVLNTVYAALSHYCRTRIAMVIFPFFDEANTAMVFRNIHLIHPDELPEYIEGGMILVNQAFIEDVFDDALSVTEQCENLFNLTDKERLKEKWMQHPILFVGVYSKRVQEEVDDGVPV